MNVEEKADGNWLKMDNFISFLPNTKTRPIVLALVIFSNTKGKALMKRKSIWILEAKLECSVCSHLK